MLKAAAGLAPLVTRPWGRTPVRAIVDGVSWRTSIWRDSKTHGALLAAPDSWAMEDEMTTEQSWRSHLLAASIQPQQREKVAKFFDDRIGLDQP